MDNDSLMRLIYFGLLLAALSGSLIAAFRRSPGRTTQSLMIWGLIFAGLVAAYGLWPDIRRALLPDAAVARNGQVELRRADDGHFYAQTTVNDVPLTFLIDTGASDIVLTRADAKRAGIDPDRLHFTDQASTANGTIATAPTRLTSLTLGDWTDTNLAASVNGGALDQSLLGMRYLSRFRITLSDDRMTLGR
jgi:aspartyl protease family protein